MVLPVPDDDCTVWQVVVNALVQAIPSIFNVLLVCLVFWLVFGIMGVTLFSGRFSSCEDSEQNLADAELVPDKFKCLELAHLNYSWTNPTINFDSVPAAYLSLFQVVKHIELILLCLFCFLGMSVFNVIIINIIFPVFFRVHLFIVFAARRHRSLCQRCICHGRVR